MSSYSVTVTVKLSPLSINPTQLQHEANPKERRRKRKRKQNHEKMVMQGLDGNLGTNKKNSSDNGGIDELSDDVLISILSHLTPKEAARTSVLARRWRYLWMFHDRTLRFDRTATAKRIVMKWKKFESWVNKVVELQQPGFFTEGMIISVQDKQDMDPCSQMLPRLLDNCVYFATQKEVQRLEVNLSSSDEYEFPSIERLTSHSHGLTSPLCRLRTLRLTSVDIKDDVFHYLLTSCANLEELCIRFSSLFTGKLRVIDPPSLRILEITACSRVKSLEISATNLVSLTYKGNKNSLVLKKIPALRTLTMGGFSGLMFALEPKEHWHYSAQLEEIVSVFKATTGNHVFHSPVLPQLCSLKRLGVRVRTTPRQSLFFLTSLIKASPQLREFRVELIYEDGRSWWPWGDEFPLMIWSKDAEFVHKELKSVEVGGYIGCMTGNEFVCALVKIGPSIERVVVDTSGDYFDPDTGRDSYFAFGRRTKKPDPFLGRPGASTRKEAKQRARNMFSKFFPQHIQATVT